jgi:enoyl-CoA hydratase/carnithine racemase
MIAETETRGAGEDLLIAVSEGVVTITLNQPERKRTFTFPMIEAWTVTPERCRTDATIRVVIVTGAGGAHFLPRLLGTVRALEMFFTGDVIDAAEALRIGLVNGVHDDAALVPAVEALARRIAQAPPLSLSLIKRAAYQGLRNALQTNRDLISSHYAVITAVPEHRDAVRAFIGGRDREA